MKNTVFGLIIGTILISGTPLVFAEYEPYDAFVLIQTNSGDIIIELFPLDAPRHVENFINLVNDGFYDGTLFHRVISDFMIQGGDPNTKDPDLRGQWGMGGPDDLLDAEFNTIKHDRGIVSMARSADPNSAGSQFFIVHKDSNFLDEEYTVFGRIVVEHSFETLDKIANLETDAKDIPLDVEEVRINRAMVLHAVQVVDLPELQEPERTRSTTSEGGQIVTREGGEQVYTSKQLGIQFNAPEGWLLQHPPKIDHNSPDVVAVGANTGTTPPAISVTIEKTDGRTFEQTIEKKKNMLQPLIEVGTLTMKSEKISVINGQDAHTMIVEGYFETKRSPNDFADSKISIIFIETTIYDNKKTYTIASAEEQTKGSFEAQLSRFEQVVDSFEILSDQTISGVYKFEATQAKDVFDSEGHVIEGAGMETQLVEETEEDAIPYPGEGGGCLIATAAYGSEMAPQVQFLRELRDNTVLQTQSGTAFMTGFNQFYYSFSPAVADYERENPMFKEVVKVTLTPLLTSLTLLNYVDIDTEEEMLGYGIGVILLNIGMYFVAPAAVIIAIKNRINYQTSSTSSNSL